MDRYYSSTVYGPIESRRLGRALGINLLPLSRKVCSFNCIYCECGMSRGYLSHIEHRDGFLKPDELRQKIERCFRWHAKAKTPIDYISFAGNGEPTLYPYFEEATDIVIRMRDKYLSNIPTAIFTNATAANEANIARSLNNLNRRFMKLDAGDFQTYQLINKPLVNCSLDTIVLNLSRLKNTEISTAVVDGIISNVDSLKSESFVKVIEKIDPLGIFIYAIDRPSAYSGIMIAAQSTLCGIGDFLKSRLRIPVTVLDSKKHRPSWFDEAYAGMVPIAPPVVYSTEKEEVITEK